MSTDAFRERRDLRRQALSGQQPLAGVRYRLECVELILKRARAGGLSEAIYRDVEALLCESVTERPAGYSELHFDA